MYCIYYALVDIVFNYNDLPDSSGSSELLLSSSFRKFQCQCRKAGSYLIGGRS